MEDLIGIIFQVSFFLGLLGFGYFIGRKREMSHFESIRRRERELISLPAHGGKGFINEIAEVSLVSTSVVIGQDYFKSFAAGLRSLLGGRMSSYESLLDRARREATLRLKEEAKKQGMKELCMLRFETSGILSGKSEKGLGAGEFIVYATAGK